jgi:transposase InsO family protein
MLPISYITSHNIVCCFGLPKSIQSDNGPHFANEAIERLTQILEIRHKFSIPYYPQSNGRAERLIGILKSMMVKAVEDTDRDETNGTVNW